MSTPSIPDPLLAAVNVARSLLTGRPESFALGFSVGTLVPDPTSRPAVPYVLVAVDGLRGINRKASDERALVRVSVFHKSGSDALALAILLRSLLLAFYGDTSLRGFQPDAGPVPATDPDTGEPLATFTVSALLRPTSF